MIAVFVLACGDSILVLVPVVLLEESNVLVVLLLNDLLELHILLPIEDTDLLHVIIECIDLKRTEESSLIHVEFLDART